MAGADESATREAGMAKPVGRMTTDELWRELEINGRTEATGAVEESLMARAEEIETELDEREHQAAANRGEMNGYAPEF